MQGRPTDTKYNEHTVRPRVSLKTFINNTVKNYSTQLKLIIGNEYRNVKINYQIKDLIKVKAISSYCHSDVLNLKVIIDDCIGCQKRLF